MVNGLDNFLRERRLVQTSSIAALKDTRLGIDLELYLRRLLASPETAEPVIAALGGVPLALVAHIESDLRTFDRSRVKPIFVLSGLPPLKKGGHFVDEEARCAERARAWDAYDKGEIEKSKEAFAKSDSVLLQDLIRGVLRAFRHRDVEFMVAPYMASGQLVALERHTEPYVHSIWARDDALMFDRLERLVLNLHLNKESPADSTFEFVTKASILAELHCTEEEFLDASILAGFEYSNPYPLLFDGTFGLPAGHFQQNGTPVVTNLPRITEIVKQHRTGYTLVSNFESHPSMLQNPYTDSFCKARSLIKYSLVITAEDGSVLPLPLSVPAVPPTSGVGAGGLSPPGASNAPSKGIGGNAQPNAPVLTLADIPSDLQNVFSMRLPDEVYLHISRGLIASNIPRYLTSGVLVEHAPYDNGDSDEYRRFVRDLTENPQGPRCVAIALLRSTLHQSWATRKVSAVYWFAPPSNNTIPHNSTTTQSLIARVNQWNVTAPFIEEELRRQNSSTIDIALCLGATGLNALAGKTKTPRNVKISTKVAPIPLLDKKDEVVANVIWRMLELRGFLNHDHLHTPYARALHLGLKASRLNDKLQEPLFLALELLRASVLHGNPYGSRPADSSVVGEEHTRSLVLVSRCLSLLPLMFKAEPWNPLVAPMSRELLVFNSFVRSLGRSMRLLVEMIASSMLLRGDARRARDDHLDISLSLPFQQDPNTGLGIMVRCYLEGLLSVRDGQPVTDDNATSDEVMQDKKIVLEMLEPTFTNVKDTANELKRGFRFWGSLMEAVRILKGAPGSISAEIVNQFEAADEWVRPLSKI